MPVPLVTSPKSSSINPAGFNWAIHGLRTGGYKVLPLTLQYCQQNAECLHTLNLFWRTSFMDRGLPPLLSRVRSLLPSSLVKTHIAPLMPSARCYSPSIRRDLPGEHFVRQWWSLREQREAGGCACSCMTQQCGLLSAASNGDRWL